MDLYFNELIIIQSLPAGEFQTGQQLYDHLAVAEALPIPVQLINIVSASDLFDTIDVIRSRATGTLWVPMIHLEIHGAAERDGLVMASKEFVHWEDVASRLRLLNIAVRNSLVLVLGVCSGAFVMTAARYETECLTGDILAKRVKKILRKAPPQEVAKVGGRNKARAMIVRQLKDNAERRDRMYSHFIMSDLYPENAQRLPPLDAA